MKHATICEPCGHLTRQPLAQSFEQISTVWYVPLSQLIAGVIGPKTDLGYLFDVLAVYCGDSDWRCASIALISTIRQRHGRNVAGASH